MLDSLPNTPLKHQNLMNFDQKSSITTALPVASYTTDGSVLSDLILAFYIDTGSKRVVLGFNGTGWQPIEEVSPETTFTTDEDDLFTWFDNQQTHQWLAANASDSDGPLTVYETNKPDAPQFLKSSENTD